MGYTGGVDLGGTKIQTVVVDDGGEVAGQSRRPTPTTGGPADVASEIAGALRDAAAQAGVETSALDGIGIGSPGKVDDDAGTCRGAKNLPGWAGSFDLRTRAREGVRRAGVGSATTSRSPPTRSSRSAPAAPYRSLLGVFWGTGVGGGIVLDGKPWIGRDAAGEIGHVVVRQGGGRCAAAAAAAAWRPTPAAPRWRPARAGAPIAARRPCSSRSWRSAAARA